MAACKHGHRYSQDDPECFQCRDQSYKDEISKLRAEVQELKSMLSKNEGRVKEIVDESLVRQRDVALLQIGELKVLLKDCLWWIGNPPSNHEGAAQAYRLCEKIKKHVTSDTRKEPIPAVAKPCELCGSGEQTHPPGTEHITNDLCEDGQPHNYEPHPDTERICCKCQKSR